ncbi:hypothetical protein GOBAR_AA25681 [Gossypium barbadense]|uniref:O-fucosyltransferase family protein n=1 Tax=Gossypium barbadense TaxID=3634 RepID=A0A2P5WV74_GOSBA|nr:hypothetical protein GOBAR_AA25681 [Gossypium barbadense]
MDRDSSDEDDARRNLTYQNDTTRSGFNVEGLEPQMRRRSKLTFHKGYLFALVLPLLIVFIYFSIDIRSLFTSDISSFKFNTVSSQIRESQLQALHLLNQQQSSLLSIWNHTLVNSNNITTVQFDDIKATLLTQITLNKHIQQILLSPYKAGDTLQNGTALDPSSAGYGFHRCRKVDQKFSERRTIEWKPRRNKFLFAICLSGQMSNHLICLEKHMFFAAILNRALVIPSSRFDYQYNRVLDIEHINDCIGKKVVVPFEDFMKLKKNHAHIDKFICYFSTPQPCYMDEEHLKKLKSLGISMGKLEAAWKNEDVKNPSRKTVKDVEEKFGSDDDVIAIGDVYFADVERDWVLQPGGPIAHKCKTLIEPSKLILLTAERFIQTFLGNAKKPSCFYPIPQAADCITRMVERANSPVIYLSTDAAGSETGLLQSMIMLNGKTIPLVKHPPHNSAEKWDALLYRHGLEGDSQVEAMLDKTICAMASVFIGASGSTFTEDILRLRKDWGTASICDEYLCQGENPNFISANTPSTVKELWKKMSSNSKQPLNANAELLVDFVSNKMNKAGIGLEKAPEGSFKNKLHGYLKPKSGLFKIFIDGLDYVGSMCFSDYAFVPDASNVLQLKCMACATKITTYSLEVLPLPNVLFFWVLFRTYSHWQAFKFRVAAVSRVKPSEIFLKSITKDGSEKLLQLDSDYSIVSNLKENESEHNDSKYGTKDSSCYQWVSSYILNLENNGHNMGMFGSSDYGYFNDAFMVLEPSKELTELLRGGAILDICI